ncbi:glucose dehydrogenase, partial [Paraburkholderia sp. GAS41]|uniref:hypothetical protein n=1 Tax=Paraburkholderia sp. GAS41 TaxID=3035134 RepID=UPI003D1A736A
GFWFLVFGFWFLVFGFWFLVFGFWFLVFGFWFLVWLPAVTWFVVVPALLAFPCFVIGLLASPLCGAALTFFAAAKKVSKESGLKPPVLRCPSLL